MFRVPTVYRVPLGIAIALHIALIIWLIVKPSAVSYRTDEPKVIVQATVVSASSMRANPRPIQATPTPPLPPSKPVPAMAAATPPPSVSTPSQQAPASVVVPQESPDAKLLAAQAARIKADATRRQLEAQAHQLAIKKELLEKKMRAEREQALQKEQRQLQQKMLESELAQEEKALQQKELAQLRATQSAQKAVESRAQAAANQGVLDRYRAAILQTIRNNWHPPAQTDLTCQLAVHLGPGGVVLSVDLLQSSGDPALDQSAEVAVMKASPLPVPTDATLFDEFRTFHIKMSPQEIA